MQLLEIQSKAWLSKPGAAKVSEVRVQDMTDSELHALWLLFRQIFHGVEADFKEGVRTRYERFSLYYASDTGQLIGFLGFRRKAFPMENGRSAMTIGMGPSYIKPEYRGKNLVQRSVIRYMLRAILQHPFRRLFLWTAAGTYRPYLLVARNLVDYAPARCKAERPELESLRLQIGKWYYKDEFDSESNTVRLRTQPLSADVCRITDADWTDPDIAHFALCNPGHARADAIIVVIPASLQNLLHFIKRRVFHG